MNTLLSRIDRLRLLALLLWAVPVAALVPLGLLWLWQMGAMRYWLVALVLFSAAGYGLQAWLHRHERRLLHAAETESDPDWPPAADGAWALVEDLAAQTKPEDWPIGAGDRLGVLGQQTLERVARHFHPDVDEPLLELTVPHTLLIVERASRDLRETITDHIPFSHRLTVGSLMRAYRWKPFADRLLGLYRAGQWVVNPANAFLTEALAQLRGRGYALAQDELYGWILREYVRKVGTYAIELYSGRLLLSDASPEARPTTSSERDLRTAGSSDEPAGEPLRILVLGRSNAGKSSLINALFGQLRVATDLLPDTTKMLTPYRLAREGLDLALIYDTPGSDAMDEQTLRTAAGDADMILWVSAADRPDRHADRETLDSLRAAFAERLTRRPPPVLVVLSHIDRLRPVREWLPPYDLAEPKSLKAESILAAVEVVAADLAIPIASVIPVCLAGGRVYNVDDVLWAAILDRLDAAQRSRLLRCQDARKREENWSLVRRQLANAGRFLLALPERSTGARNRR
ncbi:GTPase family protein [Thiocapsa bogorovii]|uniref:GTPase family protein n=1 Tax=Thiocapsa bogorovii TaxID=521689 RepID=UPI001E5B934A|nr:GTPase domain-containing protein [Thiocapsa bogorovii]UHD16719.1 50S ribosome-binding GTPase [Thiocapsa bogorovii]